VPKVDEELERSELRVEASERSMVEAPEGPGVDGEPFRSSLDPDL